MCESAAFGEKLHNELSRHGIYCDVVARTSINFIETSEGSRKGLKKTLPLDLDKKKYHTILRAQLSKDPAQRTQGFLAGSKLGVHQQFGSKVVYSWNDKNKQVMKHAYDGLFKRKIIDAINKQLEKNDAPPAIQNERIELMKLIDELQDDELIKNTLEAKLQQFIEMKHKDIVLMNSLPKFIDDYHEGKKLLAHAKDNFRIIANSETPLYRFFDKSNYSETELIEKKIIDGIFDCRDSMPHPPERLAGINRLLDDISKENLTIKDKLDILCRALNEKSDPYKINQFGEGIFNMFTFSTSPTLTKAYIYLKEIYDGCAKEYSSSIRIAK